RWRGGSVRRTPGNEVVPQHAVSGVCIRSTQRRKAVRVARAGTGTPGHVADRIGCLDELALGEIPICAGHRVHVQVTQEGRDVALVLGKVSAKQGAEVLAAAVLDMACQ